MLDQLCTLQYGEIVLFIVSCFCFKVLVIILILGLFCNTLCSLFYMFGQIRVMVTHLKRDKSCEPDLNYIL